MVEQVLSNRKVQTFVRLITALSFALFTAYQLYMALQTETYRRGRQIGIIFYLVFTVASVLAFCYMRELQNIRTILMLCGLILLFAVRLPTVGNIIKIRNPDDPSSVLNCVAYILPQFGTLSLTLMYLLRRRAASYRRISPLICLTILIYTACFVVECVLMIHYRMNIDGDMKLALISRLLYFVGFSGTAFSFMFSDPSIFERSQLHSDRTT